MTWKWVTIILAAAILAAGCSTTPQQTATQQILEQTTDPIAIGKALVLDAEDAFAAAWQAYEPNRMVIQARHPEQAQQLDRAFAEASAELDLWHQYAALGQVGNLDATTFPAFRRSIITMLVELEKGVSE
jgi:ABC-type glycerol-3-phosphate transport system substrate-binding protein